MKVKAWKEIVSIPTYRVGKPDKNPMFLENRVYQGSSGEVYPYPVIDKVYSEKEDKDWIGLFLENDYIRVMILPELGGRIQMAVDKTNGYHFVYYNSVIKPALVGLTGPWVSGGIEFNWPQHHRPSTFSPLDYSIEENSNGSKTIWVNEYEVMNRTRGTLGFTLYPDKAYIELKARLINRTPFPQTFLWWANPAVAVDESYQSIFPPDVHAVFDHGKRNVTSYPIANSVFNKVDYSPGTDISRYLNIPVPTSYMAANSHYDFIGGYNHSQKAGLMHIADHHISPGKKQWTWGSGDFGKMWDKQLTDNDGPYFELMCGVYTDNQPDFSWIMPNEVREFKQYFMPFKEIGHVKNATIDAMVNLQIEGQHVHVGVYVTSPVKVIIRFKKDAGILWQKTVTLEPNVAFEEDFKISNDGLPASSYKIEVVDEKENLLVAYSPGKELEEKLPEPAKAIAIPEEIDTNESLFLAGQHLEQYRHANHRAEDYYLEALKRDPSDLRSNNAMGLQCCRRGQFDEAMQYFLTAIKKLTQHNPNPFESEPYYNAGVACLYLQRVEEAYDMFYKSTWTGTFQDRAWYELAAIETSRGNLKPAMEMVEKSLCRNGQSPQAKHLKTIILRKQGKMQQALQNSLSAFGMDLFDYGNLLEHHLLLEMMNRQDEAEKALAEFLARIEGRENSFIELAIDCAKAGEFTLAIRWLKIGLTACEEGPLLYYYIGYYYFILGQHAKADEYYKLAFEKDPAGIFPHRLEDYIVLKHVISLNDADYNAHFFLGNFLYANKRFEEAALHWEQCSGLIPNFPTALRNLAIAYFNKLSKKKEAALLYEKAFLADKTDARILFEWDQLQKLLNEPLDNRLELLNQHKHLVKQRDDLYLEFVTLHALTGNFEQAKMLIDDHQFHPWEGGEGMVAEQYRIIHMMLALNALKSNDLPSALGLLKSADNYPENLSEGKLFGVPENDLHYWMGCAHEMLNDKESALREFKLAFSVPVELSLPLFYNDHKPDKAFYQGLAYLKIGQQDEAERLFDKMIEYGIKHLNDKVKLDFFAVSYPNLMVFNNDLVRDNIVHCYFLQALGWMGKGNYEKAKSFIKTGLDRSNFHIGLNMLNYVCQNHASLLHNQQEKASGIQPKTTVS